MAIDFCSDYYYVVFCRAINSNYGGHKRWQGILQLRNFPLTCTAPNFLITKMGRSGYWETLQKAVNALRRAPRWPPYFRQIILGERSCDMVPSRNHITPGSSMSVAFAVDYIRVRCNAWRKFSSRLWNAAVSAWAHSAQCKSGFYAGRSSRRLSKMAARWLTSAIVGSTSTCSSACFDCLRRRSPRILPPRVGPWVFPMTK